MAGFCAGRSLAGVGGGTSQRPDFRDRIGLRSRDVERRNGRVDGPDVRPGKAWRKLASRLELEDLLNAYTKGSSDPESQGQGGHIPPLFQGANGLAGTPGGLGQFLLGHLVVLEAQAANLVDNVRTRHRQPRR